MSQKKIKNEEAEKVDTMEQDLTHLKNEINALKSEIKRLNLELNSAKGRQQFNEQDMERFENIFKVVKQRTRHGDEYKVFQKLNSMYNVI